MKTLFGLWIAWRVRRSGSRTREGWGRVVREAGARQVSDVERETLEAIEAERRQLIASREVIEVQDFGAGYAGGLDRARHGSRPRRRAVSDIVRRAAIPSAWGWFLFLLVRRLAPHRVLEMGTSLGISGAYLAAALQLNRSDESLHGGRLVTLEGDPGLALRAGELLDRHAMGLARVITGRFDETLAGVMEEEGPFDLVFIDGHHEEAATWRYFQIIRPHVRSGGIVVFDDLEPWSSTVHRAWRRIVAEIGPAQAIHLGKMGLLRIP